MAYRVTKTTTTGIITHDADCIYDFNPLLASPFGEPSNGDWHSIDDAVELMLADEGWELTEIP